MGDSLIVPPASKCVKTPVVIPHRRFHTLRQTLDGVQAFIHLTPMALKATVYKAELEIVDIDRHVYETRQLTLARHPSENDERLMARILVFALNAAERLEFGGGVAVSEEPDLWIKDYSGDIELWIELGHPDAKVLTKAMGRAKKVAVYAYSALPERWWDPIKKDFENAQNLEVFSISAASIKALASMAKTNMKLQCQIQEGDIWFRDDEGAEAKVEIRTVF